MKVRVNRKNFARFQLCSNHKRMLTFTICCFDNYNVAEGKGKQVLQMLLAYQDLALKRIFVGAVIRVGHLLW